MRFSTALVLLVFITTLKIKPTCGKYVWQRYRSRDVTKNSSSRMNDAFSGTQHRLIWTTEDRTDLVVINIPPANPTNTLLLPEPIIERRST